MFCLLASGWSTAVAPLRASHNANLWPNHQPTTHEIQLIDHITTTGDIRCSGARHRRVMDGWIERDGGSDGSGRDAHGARDDNLNVRRRHLHSLTRVARSQLRAAAPSGGGHICSRPSSTNTFQSIRPSVASLSPLRHTYSHHRPSYRIVVASHRCSPHPPIHRADHK